MRRALVLACFVALVVCASPAAAATPWRAAGPPSPLTSIAFSNIAGSARVYARSASRWWRSDDDGATWTATAGGSSSSNCDLRASPANPDVVYSGCGTVSSDAGGHWAGLPTIEGSPSIDAAGTLYWVDQPNARDLRCTPDGLSCATITPPDSFGLLVDPASAAVLATNVSGGIAVSSDAGASWSAPRALPADLLDAQVSFDGRVPRKLIAVGLNASPMRVVSISLDAGLTWSARRLVPLPHETSDDRSARSGGTGSQRRTWLQSSHDAAWTADDGVTFHAVHMPFLNGALTVDPNDGAHLFLSDGIRLLESRDSGASWALRNSSLFGSLRDSSGALSGSGSTLYAASGGVAFVSGDAGLTWTVPPDLVDAKLTGLVASRDDPRVAYASGSSGNAAGFWQTVDGGTTWVTRTVPPAPYAPVGWIEPGHPDWVFLGESGSLPVAASHDGGRSWFSEPIASMCLFSVAVPANQTHGTATCGPLLATDPQRAPWDQAFDAVQYVQLDAGAGVMIATSVLGRVNADWSFDAVCAPTTKPGTCSAIVSYTGVRTDAWIGGGHITYAYYDGSSLWAMRDSTRWWRLPPPPGSDAGVPGGPLLPLSHSQLIANGLLVTLEAPDVGVPKLSLVSGPLHCSTALLPDVAALAYGWRRDGAVIAGTTADHTIVAADEGHALGCTVTASNAWGSTTGSSATYRVAITGTAGSRRLALTGHAFAGSLLHCGATQRIDWLRDGHAIKGQHARTFRVRPGDEGHALACRSRTASETLASLPLHVPRARGGEALALLVTP
jgi:hypothetical protein